MQAGKLRHFIVIQKPVETISQSGDTTLTWLNVDARPASIAPLSGREIANAEQIQADVTHKIIMRGDSVTTTIIPKWRVEFNKRVFNIVSVLNKEERGIEIELRCKEQV